MKRKFITGLGLVTLIFTISGIFILANIRRLASTEDLRDKHEKILDQYEDILFNVKNAQAELYRHEAGFSRDIDKMIESALGIEDVISDIKGEYGIYAHIALCNSCHPAQVKIDALQARLDQISRYLKRYEEKMSLIVTVTDDEFSNALEKEAMKDSDKISTIVNDSLLSTTRMTRQMDLLQMTALREARFSIILAIIVSSMMSLGVMVWMIRSIRRPLSILVEGIERVGSGEYDSKIAILADDDIGLLAKTFNTMTDNLKSVTREKELLLEDLRQFNSDLEDRVFKATEQLRLTHQQMLRSETLSAVGTFASGVAHELATPLSSILSYVQVMRKRVADNGQLSDEMALVEKELLRCTNILRGMLAFARAPEKEKVSTEINAILRDLLALVRYQAKYKKIKIKENLGSGIPPVMAIAGQLRQVFMNIIVNALESMGGEGELEVLTFGDGDGRRVVVKISDTGCGIPEADLKNIFQPFYTRKNTGTGLGLSISYGIVKGHGGDIEVESEEGKGATFVVSLPVEADKINDAKPPKNKKELTTEIRRHGD